MDGRRLVNTIPDPDTVRDRLSEAIREVALLRRLLRLSEQAAKYPRQEGQEQQREGAVA